MASAAEYTLLIAAAGAAATVTVAALVPNGVVKVYVTGSGDGSWTAGEWTSVGSLGVALLAVISSIYFKWREDRRATQKLEQRITNLEEEKSQE